jgi:predicted CoA-binding protein
MDIQIPRALAAATVKVTLSADLKITNIAQMDPCSQVLVDVEIIVLVDWPSRDVPDTLVHQGFIVFVKGGPEPDHYNAQELRDEQVVPRRTGRPEHADLVYAHRPLGELPAIVALAQQLGAKAVWRQTGLNGAGDRDPHGCWSPEEESREARRIVESAGLAYVENPYIADVAREIGRPATSG